MNDEKRWITTDDEYTDGTLLSTTASDALGSVFLLFFVGGISQWWHFSEAYLSFFFYLHLHCIAWRRSWQMSDDDDD